jgi:hypothetical protein
VQSWKHPLQQTTALPALHLVSYLTPLFVDIKDRKEGNLIGFTKRYKETHIEAIIPIHKAAKEPMKMEQMKTIMVVSITASKYLPLRNLCRRIIKLKAVAIPPNMIISPIIITKRTV